MVLYGAGVSPVYPDTLAYFKCYCELDGAGVSPVYIDAMVISYLKLFLFPCYCGLYGAGVSPVYPDTLAYFPCYCELDGAGVSPVYIDTVVFSRYLLSFLELSFAKHNDELLLAVGAFYKSKGLRILVCTFCLPQLQHRTLSALARVSLASHGLLRVDQLIRRGVFTICT